MKILIFSHQLKMSMIDLTTKNRIGSRRIASSDNSVPEDGRRWWLKNVEVSRNY